MNAGDLFWNIRLRLMHDVTLCKVLSLVYLAQDPKYYPT